MDPMAPPPMPNPTTPPHIFPQMKLNVTPNRFVATFSVTSQPPDSTQHALQELLTDNMVFTNKVVIQAIFQLSKVKDQNVMHILAKINKHKPLKVVQAAVLSGKGAEMKKYKAMVHHLIVVSGCANLSPLAYTA